MATYDMGKWRGNPQISAPKKFLEYERVLDLSAPPYAGREELGTTAWAVGDVVELIGIRSNQIVLGVWCEVLIAAAPSGSRIQIGYGSETNRWGTYSVDSTGLKTSDDIEGGIENIGFTPFKFTASDTIDVVLFNQVMTAGKIRITALLLDTLKAGKKG